MKKTLTFLLSLVCISAFSGIVLTPATTNTNPAAVAAWIGATNNGDFKSDGSVPMTGPLNLGGQVATNGATPTRSDMIPTKGYTDTAIAGATNTLWGALGSAAHSNATDFASATSLTTVSNGLNVVSNGLTSTSNSLITVSNNLTVVSNGLNTVSNKLNSVSNSLTVVSNGLNVVSNGFTLASNNLTTVSNNVNTLSNNLNADNLITGTLPTARLPAFTGDVTSTSGSSTLTLGPSGVTAGSYTSADVTVGSDGRITSINNGSGGSGIGGITTGTYTWGDQQNYSESVAAYQFGGAIGVLSDNTTTTGSNILANAVYTTKVTFPDGMKIIDEGISAAIHVVSPYQNEQLIVGVKNWQADEGGGGAGQNVFVFGDNLNHADPIDQSGTHINFAVIDDTTYIHTIQFDDASVQTAAAFPSLGANGEINFANGLGGWLDSGISYDSVALALASSSGQNIQFDDGNGMFKVGLNTYGQDIRFSQAADIGTYSVGTVFEDGNALGFEFDGIVFFNGQAQFPAGADFQGATISNFDSENSNIAPFPTTVQTNFISGTTYTSPYSVPITVSCNVALSVAAVSGNAGVELRIPGVITNTSGMQTLITSIAMKYTNIISGIVPAGGTYSFVGTTAGTGNAASLIGGQISIP